MNGVRTAIDREGMIDQSQLLAIEAAKLTLADAQSLWWTHKADRAWIEWGICWPPISVARPRCTSCGDPWPCTSVLCAHARLHTDAPAEGHRVRGGTHA